MDFFSILEKNSNENEKSNKNENENPLTSDKIDTKKEMGQLDQIHTNSNKNNTTQNNKVFISLTG